MKVLMSRSAAILNELVEKKITGAEAARQMGMAKAQFNRYMVRDTRVTAPIAAKLREFFGDRVVDIVEL